MTPAVLRTFVGEAVRLRIDGGHYIGKLIAQGSEFRLAPIVGLNHHTFAVTNGLDSPFVAENVAEIRRVRLAGGIRIGATPSLR